MAMYVNIRTSVRPGDELVVHVFHDEDAALFISLRGGKECVLSAFGHYGSARPVSQEEIKCASLRLQMLINFCAGGDKPAPCEEFDFSKI